MLGKQWLNRYESTDMRGTTIERIHSRQRKLGGVVGWYFDYVMESLPLMLQSALLLLGYAISRYLWEINTTIASVVLGVTLLGVTFYVFIVLAGTFSESCPYQTPAAHLFRYTFHYLRINLLPAIRSTPVVVSSFISRTYYASWSCRWLVTWSSDMRPPWYSTSNITNALQFPILLLTLVMDVYCFGRMVIRSLIAFCTVLLRRLVGSRRTTHRWSTVISSLRPLIPGQQAIKMDLQCISWILQTSLDRVIHLSAFKHLTSMPHLSNFHPTLVVDCFNIFLRCININNGKVVISQGSEELAPASASGFFRILHHLATMDPASSFLTDLQQRYNDVFPSDVDFTDLPFQSTMAKIHTLAGRFGHPRDIPWHPRTTSIQEHVPFVRSMAEAVRERYGKPQGEKVPSRILRSVLYFLSLGSISPASVVADCLTIVAIDLGCDVSDVANLDERCVEISWVATCLTKNQCTGGVSLGSRHPRARNHGQFGSCCLEAQGYQCPTSICNLSGTGRAARDDGCNPMCRQGLQFPFLESWEIHVAPCLPLHLSAIRRTEPYFLGSGHHAHFALRTLERCAEQSNRSRKVGGSGFGDSIFRRGWPKCCHDAVSDRIHSHTAFTRFKRYVGMDEEATATPLYLQWSTRCNEYSPCQPCPQPWRH